MLSILEKPKSCQVALDVEEWRNELTFSEELCRTVGVALGFKFKKFFTAALQTEPVEANIQGSIPAWLHGCFVRNGPGTFSGMKHLFDGYAMLAKFEFENGSVKVSHK